MGADSADLTDIVFRLSPPVDNEALNALFSAAWPDHTFRDFETVLARSLMYVCAYDAERLVGFANLAWDGGVHGFLLDVSVHPELRRRGIGRALVNRLLATVKDAGLDWIHVDHEPQLREFYASCGFRPTDAGLLSLSEGKAEDTLSGMEDTVPTGRFRAAAGSDIDPILDMMHRYYAAEGYSFVAVEARRAIEGLLRDGNAGRLWVAEVEGRVCGYLAVTLGYSLEYGGRDAFVDEVYVEEGNRGQGLGREALGVAEAFCRRRGVRALHLEVEHHRELAIGLYRKVGFRTHDRHLMTKWLTDRQSR